VPQMQEQFAAAAAENWSHVSAWRFQEFALRTPL